MNLMNEWKINVKPLWLPTSPTPKKNTEVKNISAEENKEGLKIAWTAATLENSLTLRYIPKRTKNTSSQKLVHEYSMQHYA